MYGYIYETVCMLTGKKYIGMHKWDKDTVDPTYLGSGVLLKKAIKKYGRDAFECRVLEWCETREELSEREKFYISNTKAPISEEYYNLNDGGFGGHNEYFTQELTDNMLKALDYGRHLPSSNLQKHGLSEYRKTVVVSDETKAKLRANQLGRKCINNGKINKYVFETDLDNYLNSGWELGQKPKDRTEQINKYKKTHQNKDKSLWKQNISNSIKGRKWVTDGEIDRQVKPNEVDYYLSKGFRLGRSKAKG